MNFNTDYYCGIQIRVKASIYSCAPRVCSVDHDQNRKILRASYGAESKIGQSRVQVFHSKKNYLSDDTLRDHSMEVAKRIIVETVFILEEFDCMQNTGHGSLGG